LSLNKLQNWDTAMTLFISYFLSHWH